MKTLEYTFVLNGRPVVSVYNEETISVLYNDLITKFGKNADLRVFKVETSQYEIVASVDE